MQVAVSNRLWMRLNDLPVEIANELRSKFEHKNPEYFKKKSQGFGVGKETPVITTWKQKTLGVQSGDYASGEAWLTLPRGGTKRLREVCAKHGIPIEWEDNMTRGSVVKCGGAYAKDWITPQIFPDSKLVLWDHQERVVKSILEKKQGVARAPTGAGKTSALIDAIRQANVPAIVVVWETGLLDQWQTRIASELGIEKRDQGLIQGKTCRLRPITLAMQQTMNKWDAKKWSKLDGVFGFVGADEVARYAAATFVDTIDHFDALFRIGVSADETRRDGKTFLIYDFFGQVIEDIPKKELEGKGIIHDVTCNITPTNFKADWYEEDRDFTRLLEQMIADDERNARIVQETKRRYDAGETILLFSHRVEHCHTLRRMLAEVGVPAAYMLGGARNQKDFVKTVERMRNLKDSLRVAIGTIGKVGVGLDIPNLTVGIASTPIHSNRQFHGQIKGRVCRRCNESGKTGAELVYMWDREVFGRYALINLKKWNKHTNVMHLGQYVDVDQYLKEYHEEAQPDDDNGLFATSESYS